MDQRVNGCPSLAGRVVAVWTTKASSSSLSRRGRPPAHRGSRQVSPISLKRWITSRTVSSSAWTRRAMTGTVLPPAEASRTIAPRYRTELVLPRRTICWSFCPSWSVSLRTLTGSATAPPEGYARTPVIVSGHSTSHQPPAPAAEPCAALALRRLGAVAAAPRRVGGAGVGPFSFSSRRSVSGRRARVLRLRRSRESPPWARIIRYGACPVGVVGLPVTGRSPVG